MGIREVLLLWFLSSLIKKSSCSGANNKIKQNQELSNEFHKPITRKFLKRRVYSSFINNIWGADLANMQLMSKFNKGFRFILCIIDIFSKYTWVGSLKDKNGVTIVNAF